MRFGGFFCQLVEDGADGGVCVLAHDLEIVEDGTVRLHRLADAVLEHLEGDAELEAVLHEGLARGVVAAALPVLDAYLLCDALDVACDDVLEGFIRSRRAEVELPCLFVHVP